MATFRACLSRILGRQAKCQVQGSKCREHFAGRLGEFCVGFPTIVEDIPTPRAAHTLMNPAEADDKDVHFPFQSGSDHLQPVGKILQTVRMACQNEALCNMEDPKHTFFQFKS